MYKIKLNSAVLDPDSAATERTGRPVVVHHAVLAALLLPDLQLPHGFQLLGGHLHRLPATDLVLLGILKQNCYFYLKTSQVTDSKRGGVVREPG